MLQAQIKIDQGVADPGLQSAGFSLMSDAASWLLGDAPFVYTPLSATWIQTTIAFLTQARPVRGSNTTPPLVLHDAAGENDHGGRAELC